METADPWTRLGSLAGRHADGLSAPGPGMPGLCRTCLGPVPPGQARCYPCGQHAQMAPGSLAAAVLPVAYAVKGGAHARRLWVYKSAGPGAAAAGRALTVLLLCFLRGHAACLGRQAGWSAGPSHLAAVPSGRGRAGPHPLRVLAQPCLRLPWVTLESRPGADSRLRDLDPERFTAGRPGDGPAASRDQARGRQAGRDSAGGSLAGARVLLLDDTWTTGASIQSAAMTLRRAGAASVAALVLGRHLREQPAGAIGFRAGSCAFHQRGQ